MKIEIFLQQEKVYIKDTEKKAKRALSLSLLACSLVFVFQLIAAFVYVYIPPNLDVYSSYLIDIVLYIFYIGLPFLIFLPLFPKFDNKHLVKRTLPKKPVLFVLGALGCGFTVNFIAAIIFPSLNDFGEPTEIVAKTPIEIILCFLMYAIIPAILEEWAFRGVILKHLLPYGKWGAIIISALLFGLGHLQPKSIINGITFGIIFGLCYEYTGSLKFSILIHFINNFISCIVSLVPIESPLTVVLSLLIYIIMGFGIGAVIYYARNGYKRFKYSLRLPKTIGYKLPISLYIRKLLLNIAMVPYAVIFAFYFYIAFSVYL